MLVSQAVWVFKVGTHGRVPACVQIRVVTNLGHTAKLDARVLGRVSILTCIIKVQSSHGLVTCPYARPCATRGVPVSHLARDSICLNIDGSIKVKEYIASVGGLVQDSNGVWMFRFCRYLGCCSVLDVERWAILDGLHLALDRGVKCILIQIDSLEAVNAIQQLLTKVHYWCIQHIPREENKITDALAKMVRDRRLGVRILNNPPLRG
ncbi:hypothetical protein Gotri_002701 [Gossypium trilobum]|uniref:RNase H type-1 domain-containing protein n=1 Tax=Gossypium trilobum TaxID=34281 RepID=A0A7J9F960_9ROSI|nr:hypothetical protein [Gossypium trilobum]